MMPKRGSLLLRFVDCSLDFCRIAYGDDDDVKTVLVFTLTKTSKKSLRHKLNDIVCRSSRCARQFLVGVKFVLEKRCVAKYSSKLLSVLEFFIFL